MSARRRGVLFPDETQRHVAQRKAHGESVARLLETDPPLAVRDARFTEKTVGALVRLAIGRGKIVARHLGARLVEKRLPKLRRQPAFLHRPGEILLKRIAQLFHPGAVGKDPLRPAPAELETRAGIGHARRRFRRADGFADLLLAGAEIFHDRRIIGLRIAAARGRIGQRERTLGAAGCAHGGEFARQLLHVRDDLVRGRRAGDEIHRQRAERGAEPVGVVRIGQLGETRIARALGGGQRGIGGGGERGEQREDETEQSRCFPYYSSVTFGDFARRRFSWSCVVMRKTLSSAPSLAVTSKLKRTDPLFQVTSGR